MSLGLLLPAGLAALAALLLPLLIHLSRRPERRPTAFAALRWLTAQLRPRQRLRLEEWRLLALRLLLLATLALLLARPVLFGGAGDAPWVLVAPGVDVAAARNQIQAPDAEWHWLAPGFPDLTDPEPATLQPIASLLREIDARLPAKTPVTVFVPAQLDGLDGERPRLARKLAWRVIAGTKARSAASPPARAPTLVIRHAPERAAALPYLRAATVAWSVMDGTADAGAASTAARLDVADLQQAMPGDARWLVWLAAGELPATVRQWVQDGGTVLVDPATAIPDSAGLSPAVVLWRDARGEALAHGRNWGRGRLLQLARPLTASDWPGLLDGAFAAQLRRAFEGAPSPPRQAWAAAHAPLPGGPRFPETPRPLQAWLAVLVALLFVLERWLATAPTRGRAP